MRTALADEPGSLLVFLPGQGEILRTAGLLNERVADDVILAPLYGALSPAEQDRAIAPAPQGRRKVVLATSIAETSLTIEGVRVVIDAGQSRVPRYDPSSGLTRLQTVRVSRAAADQRRGRAGRTEPGVCYRLWDEAETRALISLRPAGNAGKRPFRPRARSGAVGRGRRAEPWRSSTGRPPAPSRKREALLRALGALDAEDRITPHGRASPHCPCRRVWRSLVV